MGELEDKVVLVTGAAGGLGRAMAERFRGEGAKIVIADIKEEDGTRTASSLAGRFHRLDITREADWIGVIEAILHTHGRLDVLVNNAGVFRHNIPFLETPLEVWREHMTVNCDGVFLGCKHAIRAMRRTGKGSIVNISSRSGLVGIPGAAAYASSKAAVRNHTKTVALYCAEHGLAIRCNSIHPAAILTPMWEPILGNGPEREARMRAFVRDTPMRRFGTPDEVAAVALLLASDEAAYMTGAELNIDGGILAGSAAAPVARDSDER